MSGLSVKLFISQCRIPTYFATLNLYNDVHFDVPSVAALLVGVFRGVHTELSHAVGAEKIVKSTELTFYRVYRGERRRQSL